MYQYSPLQESQQLSPRSIQQEPLKKPSVPIKLWIIPQNAGGFGDIACALKIGNYLIENCGFSTDNISIVTTKPEIVSTFNDHALKVILPDEAQNIHATALSQILKIVVPIRSYDNINQALLKGGHPFMVIWEYGIKADKPVPLELSQTPHFVKTLGLEDDDEGILIDKKAQEYCSLSYAERLANLEKINPVLRHAILGEGDFKSRLNEFIDNSRLYIGYSWECNFLNKFIKAITNYNIENSKNLTFVFPISDDKEITLPRKLDGKIASIEVIKFDKSKRALKVAEKKIYSNEGKRITIIRGILDFNDVKWIQIAAKRETIVTGDQSLGQAISTASRFIYECLPHKVGLAESLEKLYPLNPKLEIRDGKSAPKSKLMLRYFEACKEQKDPIAQASCEICDKRNAFLKIHALIDELSLK